MPVYLDDQPVDLGEVELRAILNAAAGRLRDRGRIVAEVRLAGRVLENDEIESQQGQMLGDQELRLLSADPKDLLRASIPQVREELAQTSQAQSEIASLLRQDRRGLALAKLPGVLSIWQRAQELLGYALMLSADCEDLRVDGRRPHDLVNLLAQQLRSAKELIEAGDCVALADALAYEWPVTAQLWDRMLEGLAQRFRTVEQPL